MNQHLIKRISTIASSAICFAIAIAANSGALAAGGDTSPVLQVQVDPEITQARELTSSKNWTGAIQVLSKYLATHPRSADGFNLLGYSYRNLKRYPESFKAYETALEIDPKHRAAHEYIGEAYIQTGNLAKAEEHLSVLDKLCFLPCEEYTDLKKALAAATAKGG
jgi:cytochrome c-type biogenesis protein CcmH/NrfG